MDYSTVIKYLLLIFKIFTFLDVKTKRFFKRLLFFRLFSIVFIFFSTIHCLIVDQEFRENDFSKLHDMLIFILSLAHEVILVLKKDNICTLIEFAVDPLKSIEPSTDHLKIIEEYNKEIYLCFSAGVMYMIFTVTHWSPLKYLISTPNLSDDKCIHIVIGWVWHFKLDSYPLYMTMFSTLLNAALILKFHLTCISLICTIVKIKYKTRLLCADLNAINVIMGQTDKDFSSNDSRVMSLYCGDFQTQQNLEVTNPRTNVSDRLLAVERGIEAVLTLDLQTYFNERRMNYQVKAYLKRIVDQHVEIIK